jgi:hypothetical protein
VDPSSSDSDTPAGVYLYFRGFLTDLPSRPPRSRLIPRIFTLSATLRLNNTLHNHTRPCLDCSRTSSSTMTRRSAARSASKSSTSRTGISGPAHAATKYAFVPKLGEASRVPVLTHVPDMSVLLQQHQDDHERTVSRLPPTLR